LVSRWHELHQQGRSLSLEELCDGLPEHLAALKRHLRDVASMQAFLQRSQDNVATIAPAPPDAEQTLPPADRPAAAQPTGAVPGYEIPAELGGGAWGFVSRAGRRPLARGVPLKMLLGGSHAGTADLARFRAEAEAVARLQHPNVVQVFEVGEHGGLPFF